MKAIKILTLVAATASLGVSLLYAQADAGPRLDPATAVTLEGAVVSFDNDPGKPTTLVVDDVEMGKTVVRLGPGWYLDGLGFAAAAGESVKIMANHCTECSAGWVAVRVENLATGAVAELRDDDGRPVWRGSGRGRAMVDSDTGWRGGRGKGARGSGCGKGAGGHGGGKGGCGQWGGGQGRGHCRCARG